MRKDNGMLAFTMVAIALIFAVAFFALNANKTADYEKKEKTNAVVTGSVASGSQSGAAVPECIDGAKTPCKMDACAGEKICIGGKWSMCVLLPKVCVPNSTVACSYDNCRFGKALCDPCGNGYGKCGLVECAANEKCEKQ
ncbi:Uncharacterised protein [Candidatus Anstonella stagnisolia]|nr:Uncharacterised protein [Candidatus Anstonella stagnisolia]